MLFDVEKFLKKKKKKRKKKKRILLINFVSTFNLVINFDFFFLINFSLKAKLSLYHPCSIAAKSIYEKSQKKKNFPRRMKKSNVEFDKLFPTFILLSKIIEMNNEDG